jgi:hypothetical protein
LERGKEENDKKGTYSASERGGARARELTAWSDQPPKRDFVFSVLLVYLANIKNALKYYLEYKPRREIECFSQMHFIPVLTKKIICTLGVSVSDRADQKKLFPVV